jgi:hypothetical protein
MLRDTETGRYLRAGFSWSTRNGKIWTGKTAFKAALRLHDGAYPSTWEVLHLTPTSTVNVIDFLMNE